MAKSRKKNRTAKQTRKSRAKSRALRRTSAPKRRTSTRRIAPAEVPAISFAGPRGTTAALATAGGDTLQVTLDLRDVSNRAIRDPEAFFTFRRLSGNRQIGDQFAIELTGTSPAFSVPIFPSEVLVCEIDPKRFRFVQSPVFLGSPGPPIRRACQLLREPDEWTARFTRWQDLSDSFDGLKEVLRASPRVTLFKGANPIADLLVEETFDALSGEKLTFAKTALLNSYFRLGASEPISGTRSWFSFVRRILAIGRERFLALVDPEMDVLVRQISAHIDQFSADYERTPAENHRGNVPAAMQSRIASMISIKSTHRLGNFQLTLTRLTEPEEVLLDSDIDEHGDLLGHFLDLFKHKVTGGTHPYDIHELLVLQAGNSPGFDLGYRLE